jgi:hypothetical protein
MRLYNFILRKNNTQLGLFPLSKAEAVGGEAGPDPPTHLPRHQLCNVVARGCQHSHQSIREKSASLASRWEGKKTGRLYKEHLGSSSTAFWLTWAPQLPSVYLSKYQPC